MLVDQANMIDRIVDYADIKSDFSKNKKISRRKGFPATVHN